MFFDMNFGLQRINGRNLIAVMRVYLVYFLITWLAVRIQFFIFLSSCRNGLPVFIPEVPVLFLYLETDCPNSRLSRLSSVPPDKPQDSGLEQFVPACFHNLRYSSYICAV